MRSLFDEWVTWMVKGIGCDIIEIDRFRQTLGRRGDPFLAKLFTEEERHYCDTFSDAAPHYAARFAGKEAIAKALGTGFGAALAFHDISILPGPHGKPEVRFSPRFLESFGSIPHLLISLSHCHAYAMATAVWH